MRRRHGERGSAMGWIVTILLVLVVAIIGFVVAINQGLIEAPAILAEQSWMESFLPEPEEVEETDETVEVSTEDQLRYQLLELNNRYNASQANIESLEQQLADKDALLQQREDEIAALQDTINLARDQNISNVALIYEYMDPADAATQLENLGAERASLILASMRESKAAAVLELIDEQMATQITELIAGFE